MYRKFFFFVDAVSYNSWGLHLCIVLVTWNGCRLL